MTMSDQAFARSSDRQLMASRLPGQPMPEPVTIDVPGPGLKRDYAGVLEYWQMTRRHKLAILVAACLGALGGFASTLSNPRIYQARTTLEIQGLNQDFLNMKNVSPTVENGATSVDADIQTQVKILQSDSLLQRASAKLVTMPPPVGLRPSDRLGVWRKALRLNPPTAEQLWNLALTTAAGGVRVRSSGMNRIVEVTCDSTHAQTAADFCNTLAREYIDQNLESRWQTTEYTGQWLTKQLQDLKVKLEKQEGELQTYARATGLVFAGERNGVDGGEMTLADFQKEMSAAEADRIAKQSRYEMASSSPPGALPDVLDDLSLKDSQKSLVDLQAKLAQLTVTYTENHTEVRRVQAQISTIETSLNASRTNIVTRIRKEYEAAERRESLLAKAYAQQAGLVSAKAEETAHYSLLKRDVDATRLLYDSLLQRLKEASIASALRANNIRVVDAAGQPPVPYKPNVRQQAAVGLLFGLLVGVMFAVFRERADRTLQDPGDVSYYLSLPELGVVPVSDLLKSPRGKLHKRPGRGGSGDELASRVEMMSWNDKTSLLAESFRATLTSILFSARGTAERPHVLVLTSASPKEGKTTVVSNLATSLADINQRVLIIDADMRRPQQHAVFGVANEHGLSDLLLSKTPLDEAMLAGACAPTSVPSLYVMPSGGSRRNASSLLYSKRLPELVQLARQKFETVVIDTPPMANLADARVVARFSDGLILVVRSGVTLRDAAQLAKTRFAEDGIPILGTILNFWNPKTPGYGYYRQYYDGYYHYHGNGSGNGNGSKKRAPLGLNIGGQEREASSTEEHES